MTTLTLLFLLPLAGALAIALGAGSRRVAQLAAALQLIITLVVAGTYLFDSIGKGNQWLYQSSMPALSFGTNAAGEAVGISLSLGVNGLSVVLLLLTALITNAAVWMDRQSEGGSQNSRWRHLGTLLISAGAAGAFVSTDLFFFFAFHELALIPTFLLIAYQGRGNNRRQTAWLTTLYLGAGSLVLLAGIISMVAVLTPDGQPWDFSFAALQEYAKTANLGKDALLPALLLLLGFGTLVSLFPLHSWAARAYAAAPPATAMMHAGVLKKFGIYGLIQFAYPLLPEALAHWTPLLLVLLLGNILVIGFVTISSKRLDSLFGNASVMHMGYLFLALASLLTLHSVGGKAHDAAMAGAVLLMFAHGVSVALSFGLLGMIEARTGTLEIARIGGLARRMPTMALLFGIALFASIGLPGLANFAGEFLIFLSGFGVLATGAEATSARELLALKGLPEGNGLLITTLLAILGVLISAIYALRAFRRSFHEGSQQMPLGENENQLAPAEWVPASILAAVLLFAGCFPMIILQFIQG